MHHAFLHATLQALAALAFAATLGPNVEPVDKLIVVDASAADRMGRSVAIDGNTAVVGASHSNAGALDSGAAYLFDLTTSEQLFKLTAEDADFEDWFGTSVAIGGEVVLVGALANDNAGSNSGAAYVFDRSTGEQRFKLTASDAGLEQLFGCSVATNGNVALVGAKQDHEEGYRCGAAYLFDTRTGEQLRKLTADDAEPNDRLGHAVALSDTVALVGAIRSNNNGTEDWGVVYVFDLETGEQRCKLTASDAAASDLFGHAVAISGEVAIVAALCDDHAAEDAGAAYLFDITTGQELHKLTADDAAANDRFGMSVAIDGDLAIVGASLADDPETDSGAAYVFDIATGEQLAKITAADAAAADNFGSSVAIENEWILVGAPRHDESADNAGAAYLYSLERE